MTQADTPDYQRGVISAQKLLGTIPIGGLTATVGVPPNAETIVVMVTGQSPTAGAYAEGFTTGMIYPVGTVVTTVGTESTVVTWIDVSAAVDDQVTVHLDDTATDVAYIYSDSAVHTVNDPIITSVLQGVMNKSHNALWTMGSAPPTDTGDHPPYEIGYNAVFGVASGTSILAAPGAGKRHRVFGLQAWPNTSGGLVYLRDSVTLQPLAYGTQSAPSVTLPPCGVPMSADASLDVFVSSGNIFAVVYSTTETI